MDIVHVMEQPTPRKRLGPRARHACLRCRRQKLRCDNQRPCALCARSLVECEDQMPSRMDRARDLDQPRRRSPRGTARRSNKTRVPMSVEAVDEWQVEPQDLDLHQGGAPLLNQERPSSYGLVDQLLRGYDSRSSALSGSEAIPDATPDHFSSPATNDDFVPITDHIGTTLPPAAISWALFDAYVKSVHWFMLIFHEPSLRDDMNSLLTTGQSNKRGLSTVVLILVVLLIGTKYVVQDDIEHVHTSIDMDQIQAKLLETIEKKFLTVLDQGNVGAVQVCILLSSFYFYHGRPNRCLAINSAAITMAKNLKLNRESSWPRMDTIERESRRRVWWALYVLDGYGSITYGATTIIRGAQCQVALPQNIDDTSDQCPGLNSTELLENRTSVPVTTLSYQRYKFRLYRIAEPIMGEVYFHGGRPVQDLIQQVEEINRQLLDWEKSVPPELRPESFKSLDAGEYSNPLTRIFQLQAIALRLSYDNIQLVLHRPLLVYNGVLPLPPHLRVPKPLDLSNDFWETSKELCWNSAHRTACVDEWLAALCPVQNLYITSFIGIQTFTAGVMLGIFALSKPFAAQEAKQSIGRLVKMPKVLGYRTTISDQTGRILLRLLRLILDEELKVLTSDDDASEATRYSNQAGLSTGSAKPSYLSRTVTANEPLILDASNADHRFFPTQTSSKTRTNHLPSPNEDDSAVGIMSPEISMASQQLVEINSSEHVQDPDNENEMMEANFPNQSIGTGLFDTEFLSELDDLGQGWMWGDCHQFS